MALQAKHGGTEMFNLSNFALLAYGNTVESTMIGPRSSPVYSERIASVKLHINATG